MLVLVVSLLVTAQAAPLADTRPAPTRQGLSWADSDALGRKLEAIERRPRTARPETISVSERELNSYLNLGLGPRLPQGLTEVDVRIEPDRLVVRALVDLDQVKARLPPTGAFNPISYLGGLVPVELRSRFPSSEGFGTLELEEIRLGGYVIPASLLQQMVLSATRTSENPQGFDIRAPFRLPYAVKRVRLQSGKALLDL